MIAALHALAAELAHPRLMSADVAQMGEANARFAQALNDNDVEAALAQDDAFHDVFIKASANTEIPKALERLMPRVRRLERLRFGSLSGRASVKQHTAIVGAQTAGEAAQRVKENWLSLGALIDRSFE